MNFANNVPLCLVFVIDLVFLLPPHISNQFYLVASLFYPPLFFKQPRYIHQLMKAMEDRKKEQERREERKIQKEREAEGEQFADKEAYVTSAYKKKLQEQKEEEEREKREAALEGKNSTPQLYYHLKSVLFCSSTL